MNPVFGCSRYLESNIYRASFGAVVCWFICCSSVYLSSRRWSHLIRYPCCLLIIIVIFRSHPLEPSPLKFLLIYRFETVKLTLTDLMLKRGKCGGWLVHREVVTCRKYLEIAAGGVLVDFLVQQVDGALHWEGVIELGVIDHEGRVVDEVDVRLQIPDHFHLYSVVC